MRRVLPIAAITAMLMLGAFTFSAPNASAALVEWYSAYPSANYGQYTKYYNYQTYGPYSTTPPTIYNDSAYLSIYGYDSATFYEVITWDFTNEEYEYNGTDYEINYLPPDGAEITEVYVVARWYNHHPECYMGYSLDEGATWTYSDIYVSYRQTSWRVTDLYDWDDEDINTTDTRIGIWVNPLYGNNYLLDYLGWYIGWMAEESGPWTPPDFDTGEWGGADFGYDLIYTGEGIIALLGLVGFIGLIGLPAFAYWSWKNGAESSKIGLFVKMLVVAMFLLTMVMVSISGT